jgi:hypothetical protein
MKKNWSLFFKAERFCFVVEEANQKKDLVGWFGYLHAKASK